MVKAHVLRQSHFGAWVCDPQHPRRGEGSQIRQESSFPSARCGSQSRSRARLRFTPLRAAPPPDTKGKTWRTNNDPLDNPHWGASPGSALSFCDINAQLVTLNRLTQSSIQPESPNPNASWHTRSVMLDLHRKKTRTNSVDVSIPQSVALEQRVHCEPLSVESHPTDGPIRTTKCSAPNDCNASSTGE